MNGQTDALRLKLGLFAEKVSTMFKTSKDVDEWDAYVDLIYAEAEGEGIHMDILGCYDVVLFFIDHIEHKLYLKVIDPKGQITDILTFDCKPRKT